MFKRYIGDKAFYKYVIALTLPIMIQNGITHLVNMLDNIMVGSIGPVEMNGVTIANQLIFVFNLCIFGAVGGAGIFGAQYAGNKDSVGIAHTMRFKILFCTLLAVIGMAVFYIWKEPLSLLYLQGEGDPAEAAASLAFSKEYIDIMLVGLIPFTIAQCYGSTLRETGQTAPPMTAGLIAVLVNLIGNYVLIFGHFGAPKLGVIGAAIATVISRFVEMIILIVWTHTHTDRNPYAAIIYRSLRIPLRLVGQIFWRGLPLMVNEAAWSLGFVTINQQYSLRGQHMLGANNISGTFWNVFAVSFMAVGIAVGIILGQKLGAGDKEGARQDCYKLIGLSVALGIVVGIVYSVCAFFIPYMYNTTDQIRHLATNLMLVCACAMPIDAYAHAAYFTLRSGGQAFITFLFDSCFMWVINVPFVFVMINYTSLPILTVFILAQALNLLKCFLGGWLVHKGIWIKTIVE